MLIKKFLQKEKMTQRVLADKLGCTTAFVNGLVNGKNTDIKISLLFRIHKTTGIHLDKLVKDFLAAKKKSAKDS